MWGVLSRRRERGQVLIITVLFIPILLGMAGMAVDLGTYASERRELQRSADAIALAAGQALPDTTQANLIAQQWAVKNNIPLTDMNVQFTGGSTEPAVRVTIDTSHEFDFIRIVGIDEADVGATAVAGKFSAAGGAGVVPWSVTQDTVDASESGALIVIKYDSNGGDNGNFGAIRIDGNGASDYEASAKYGADSVICSDSAANCAPGSCPGSYPATCGETAPDCDGYQCTPKTGNMTGSTRDAVDFRTGYTNSACDTFDEAFDEVAAWAIPRSDERFVYAGATDNGGTSPLLVPSNAKKTDTPTPSHTPVPATNTPTRTPTPAPATNTPTRTNTPGPSATPTPAPPTATNTAGPSPTLTATPSANDTQFGINPACNPWGQGSCSSDTASCSRRIFLIPIVEEFGNGSSDPVRIKGFALVFLEGYDNGKCQGSSCEINARFVKAELTTGFAAGDYVEGFLNFVKLIE